jgi:hypothetical protein
MKRSFVLLAPALTLAIVGCRPSAVVQAAPQRVELLKTPQGGLQPQAVVDSTGVAHLVYLAGEARAADVFYVRRGVGAGEKSTGWSTPIQVNSVPHSAIAVGTVRYAQIALGKNNRVHVAWNGVAQGGDNRASPLNYTRMDDTGAAFEPQRNLMGSTAMLDGGCSVAADKMGNVVIAWHAAPSATAGNEEARRVYVARSTDDGKTFSREQPINPISTGVCPCCAVKAFADSKSRTYVFFRAAHQKVNREMVMLISASGATPGQPYQSADIDPWNVNT